MLLEVGKAGNKSHCLRQMRLDLQYAIMNASGLAIFSRRNGLDRASRQADLKTHASVKAGCAFLLVVVDLIHLFDYRGS
ncbi:hypothetical protein [Lentilactobacillus fungorum]|uniref:hypothetical protein n=1 Tax=Lentilactobacillus fungorum TaxID=2201250 RepID=UPI001942F2E3|nr:hypothetical protein [Lentilactobacillus fungorum]